MHARTHAKPTRLRGKFRACDSAKSPLIRAFVFSFDGSPASPFDGAIQSLTRKPEPTEQQQSLVSAQPFPRAAPPRLDPLFPRNNRGADFQEAHMEAVRFSL